MSWPAPSLPEFIAGLPTQPRPVLAWVAAAQFPAPIPASVSTTPVGTPVALAWRICSKGDFGLGRERDVAGDTSRLTPIRIARPVFGEVELVGDGNAVLFAK